MTTTRTETLSDTLHYGSIKVLLALQPYSMERVRRHFSPGVAAAPCWELAVSL